MLSRRDQWLNVIENHGITIEEIRQSVEDFITSRVRRAYDLWPGDLPGCPESFEVESLPQWKMAWKELLNAEGKPRRQSKVQKCRAPFLEAHADFCGALHACRSFPEQVTQEQLHLVHDFLALLCEADKQLMNVFRTSGKVDFGEIANAAIRGLGTDDAPTDLLYRLDYRIQHLLVDEFQDTSLAQYRLVNALTAQWSAGDGRTLFVVGDPVQSIYGFREADVGLFLRAIATGFPAVTLTPLRLTANFRSTRPIVDWVNQVFSRIMSEEDPDFGRVRYEGAVATRTQPETAPTFCPFIDDKQGAAEAVYAVELARQARGQGSTAILVRSRSQVFPIIRRMREEGVPYEAVEIDVLKDEQHILDVLSLARAILHVADRIAWLACLRAPWCGLTLADFSALIEVDGKPGKRTILDLLSDQTQLQRLSPDGRQRAVRVQEILSAAVGRVGRLPLRDLWKARGCPSAVRLFSTMSRDARTSMSCSRCWRSLTKAASFATSVCWKRASRRCTPIPAPKRTRSR